MLTLTSTQGGSDLAFKPKGWGLLHLAACLPSTSPLAWLLKQGGLSVDGEPAPCQL